MARRRQFKHNIWLKVGQLERAIVTYYSEKYQRPQAGVIRGLIKQYAEADLHFDLGLRRGSDRPRGAWG